MSDSGSDYGSGLDEGSRSDNWSIEANVGSENDFDLDEQLKVDNAFDLDEELEVPDWGPEGLLGSEVVLGMMGYGHMRTIELLFYVPNWMIDLLVEGFLSVDQLYNSRLALHVVDVLCCEEIVCFCLLQVRPCCCIFEPWVEEDESEIDEEDVSEVDEENEYEVDVAVVGE